MSNVEQWGRDRPDSSAPAAAHTQTPWWLWLSAPIAALGITCSLAGIFVDRIYANETSSWAAQALGQDIANLVVLSAMVVLGYAAAQGSVRALLAWAGTVVYTAYTYVIYALAVHFGPLFLLYVAVLGLSLWALVGCLVGIDPERVRQATRPRGVRFASAFIVVLAVGFAVLWLTVDLSATVTGKPPQELRETGLLTNPVHVLDLALFLPASVLAGILLSRRAAWGYCLAPTVLSAMAGISLGIVTVTAVNASLGETTAPVVAVVIGLLGVAEALTCRRLLQDLSSDTPTGQVLIASRRNA